MIDTAKYEGHTPAPWEIYGERICAQDACSLGNVGGDIATVIDEVNAQLIADAPLLLAEVKRLREQLAKANKYVHSICQHSDSMLMDYEDYMKGDD